MLAVLRTCSPLTRAGNLLQVMDNNSCLQVTITNLSPRTLSRTYNCTSTEYLADIREYGT